MSPHEFSVPIRDLDAAGKQFRFRVPADWITRQLEGDEGFTASKDGELDVRVSKSGTDVVVHGSLKAKLEVPCARCLKPASVMIQQPLSVLMVPAGQIKGSRGESDEYEFSSEEADVLPYEGETVVLDDLVRDELLLDIPMIPLCSEDCPGISPPPDASAAKPAENHVDPRLAPLRNIKLKKE